MQTWLKGLISAASGGAGATLGVMVADPDNFNCTPAGLKKIGIVALISAAVSVLNYLKQSPLPGKDQRGL